MTKEQVAEWLERLASQADAESEKDWAGLGQVTRSDISVEIYRDLARRVLAGEIGS